MATERFKINDPTELQVANLALPILEALGLDRDAFYEGAPTCLLLGDILFDLDRDPVASAITRDVYRTSFFAIHRLFTQPGTFEFYLEVFRAIFTQDTEILFEIPGPGKLLISINGLVYDTFELLARDIVDDVYVYSNVVTSDLNDRILLQGTRGIKTQTEIDNLIPEISCYGVYTVVDLTLE